MNWGVKKPTRMSPEAPQLSFPQAMPDLSPLMSGEQAIMNTPTSFDPFEVDPSRFSAETNQALNALRTDSDSAYMWNSDVDGFSGATPGKLFKIKRPKIQTMSPEDEEILKLLENK